MSYIKNVIDTGIEIIFVNLGFLHHKETVTNVEADIGKKFI